MTLMENDAGYILYSVRFPVSEVMLMYGGCTHMLYKLRLDGSGVEIATHLLRCSENKKRFKV